MKDEHKIKKEIVLKANNFFLLDDLFALADSFILAEEILKENNFPIMEYKKYKANGLS